MSKHRKQFINQEAIHQYLTDEREGYGFHDKIKIVYLDDYTFNVVTKSGNAYTGHILGDCVELVYNFSGE